MIRAVEFRNIDLTPGLQYKLRFAALESTSAVSLQRASTACQSVLWTRSCLAQAEPESFDFPDACWLTLNGSQLAVELHCASQPPDNGEAETASGSQSATFAKVSARVVTLQKLGSGCKERICVTFDDASHFCTVVVELRSACQEQVTEDKAECAEAIGDDPRLKVQWPSSCSDALVVSEIPSAGSAPHRCRHVMEDLPSAVTECRRRPFLYEKLIPPSETDEIEKSRCSHMRQEDVGEHVVILVPGHEMHADDLRTLRNYFCLVLKTARFYIPSSHVCDCDDLHRAGVRLAQEVADCVKGVCSRCGTELRRLSFVAIAIGGLKVRAALPWLKEYADQMFCFIALCTPHLGLLPSDLSWWHRCLFLAIRTLAPSEFLETLALADGRRPPDSFVFKLSRDTGIGSFRRIVFMATQGDWRFPPFSCRAECSSAEAQGSLTFFGKAFPRWLLFAVLAVFCAMLAYLEVFSALLSFLGWGGLSSMQPQHERRWARLFRLGLLGMSLVGYRLRNYISIGPWATQKNCLDRDTQSCTTTMASNMSERMGNTQLIRVDIDFAFRWRCWLHQQPVHVHLLQNRAFLRTLAQEYAVLLR